jgi:hypothetical protein
MPTLSPSQTIKATGLPLGIRQRGNAYHISVFINHVRRTATASTLDEALSIRESVKQELALKGSI